MGASVSNGAADQLAFVAAQIVENDDIAGVQRRDEELGNPGMEGGAVDRAVDDAGCDDAVDTQPGQEGHCGPSAMGDTTNQPLAARRPTVCSRHVGLGPGLIDEDQTLGINAPLVTSPACAFAS